MQNGFNKVRGFLRLLLGFLLGKFLLLLELLFLETRPFFFGLSGLLLFEELHPDPAHLEIKLKLCVELTHEGVVNLLEAVVGGDKVDVFNCLPPVVELGEEGFKLPGPLVGRRFLARRKAMMSPALINGFMDVLDILPLGGPAQEGYDCASCFHLGFLTIELYFTVQLTVILLVSCW